MKKTITLMLMLAMSALANAQLQNASFEQWQTDPSTIEEWIQNKPLGWILRNDLLEIEEALFYYPAETDAQDGDYALKLGIWYNYAKDEAKQTAPIDYRPTALTGYYKYTDNELLNGGSEIVKDSAKVSIYLTKWNEALSKNDTIGYGIKDLTESLDYSPFTCNVTYLTEETPDKVIVLLDCSKIRRQTTTESLICPNNTGSYFTVDNVKLETTTLGNDTFISTNFNVYPNPATDLVTISNFNGEAELYDMTGKKVLNTLITDSKPINVQALQKGIYTIRLTDGTNTNYTKLIKN